MTTATEIPQLACEPRTKLGTRYSRRLREEGRIPVVVYGHGQDPVHASVDSREATELLHHSAHLLELSLADGKQACLVKDVQWDYLGMHIMHLDLTRVDLSEEVEVEVELVLKGEPAALKEAGAVLDHPQAALTVACRADSIPETLTVDVSKLEVGDSVAASDVALPAGVKLVTEPETIVAQITIVAEAPEPEEGEAGEDEPEVIGQKEDEEAGEAEG